jgi:hypothetical protein
VQRRIANLREFPEDFARAPNLRQFLEVFAKASRICREISGFFHAEPRLPDGQILKFQDFGIVGFP